MKAIQTKYRGPTNTRGSRIVASAEGAGSLTFSYDHALDAPGNHHQAAQLYAKKKGWSGGLCTGALKDSYVHVFAEGCERPRRRRRR